MEILVFLWAIGNLFWQGFVFMKVWNWFPVELLGAPTIGLAGSMGLLLVVVFFRNINIGKKNEEMDTEERFKNVFTISLLYAFVLLLGFIFHAFI